MDLTSGTGDNQGVPSSQRTATFAASEERSHQELNEIVQSNSRL